VRDVLWARPHCGAPRCLWEGATAFYSTPNLTPTDKAVIVEA